MSRATTIGALLLLAATVAGCDRGRGTDSSSIRDPGRAQNLLVIGSGTSVGDGLDDPLRDAWPRLLYLDAFPPATVLVNAAEHDDTVADALTDQVPVAREIEADTVAIWLGGNDALAAVPVAEFRDELAELLRDLSAAGAKQLFLAELPPSDAVAAATTAAYNEAITDVARGNGAVVVPLARRSLPSYDPVADELYSTAAQRTVADAFTRAVERGSR